jgi:hypothetical protein
MQPQPTRCGDVMAAVCNAPGRQRVESTPPLRLSVACEAMVMARRDEARAVRAPQPPLTGLDPRPASAPHQGIAREWRYGALERLARKAGCSHVAVGHTATDRAETMLLNMMRGTGTAGLASMRWQRPLGGVPAEGRSGGGDDLGGSGGKLVLVRPLLDVTRERTGEECRRRQLGVREVVVGGATARAAAAVFRPSPPLRRGSIGVTLRVVLVGSSSLQSSLW